MSKTDIYLFCENCGYINHHLSTTISEDKKHLGNLLVKRNHGVCDCCGSDITSFKEELVGTTREADEFANISAALLLNELDAMASAESDSIDTISTDATVVENIKKNPTLLKEYIKFLIEAEIEVQYLKRKIILFSSLRRTFLNRAIQSEATEKENIQLRSEKDSESLRLDFHAKTKRISEEIKELKVALDNVEKKTDFNLKCPEKPMYHEITIPAIPSPPVLKSPGFFNKKRVLAENEKAERSYAEAVQKYEQLLKTNALLSEENHQLKISYDKAESQYKKELKEKREAEKQLLQDKIRELNETLVATETELKERLDAIQGQAAEDTKRIKFRFVTTFFDKRIESLKKEFVAVHKKKEALYACGIIYSTYRELVPIASFYEYLVSGRCNSLENTDGAYNLYEEERRANLITTIIIKIEEISKQQVILIRELSAMEERLKEDEALINSAATYLSRKNLSKEELTLLMEDAKKKSRKALTENKASSKTNALLRYYQAEEQILLQRDDSENAVKLFFLQNASNCP